MNTKTLITAGLVLALMFAAPAGAQTTKQKELMEEQINDAQKMQAKEMQDAISAANMSALAQQQQNIQSQSTAVGIVQEEKNAIQVYNPEGVIKHGSAAEPAIPPTLEELQDIRKENIAMEDDGMLFDIRKDAIREAGVSFGARGGLAWRTYFIRMELEERARYLDKVFDFRQLLVPAPSGLLIEPPIVSESLNAMLIQDGGQQAAVSDRIYNIINNASIVSAPRTWRTYLEREWGEIEPPPDILRPENDEERKLWAELVARGWQEGVAQADEIFEDDLNILMADFQGMVRYRSLLAQGMISPPYALQVDRGITGGKDEMRIGDRAVQITGVPELITGSEQWLPANR